MSTTQEIKRLGIIAGNGNLPAALISACKGKNIEPFIVGFEGQTDPNITQDHNHLWANLGSAGKIMTFFKSRHVKDLVLIGGIKRPSLTEMKPDFKALQILTRIGFKALGDDGLLTALKTELESEGFTLHPIHRFCADLLATEGALGIYEPLPEDRISIDLGLKISQEIGALDIGQSVIVQDGIVLGVEAAEGTDMLIERCASLQQKGRGGILVKTCKPQQDKALDMPTIGINTLINAHKAGLCGIVVQADNTLIVDSKNVAKQADQYKLFVTAMSV